MADTERSSGIKMTYNERDPRRGDRRIHVILSTADLWERNSDIVKILTDKKCTTPLETPFQGDHGGSGYRRACSMDAAKRA